MNHCNNDLWLTTSRVISTFIRNSDSFQHQELYSSTQITHLGKLGQVTPFWQVIVAIFSLWCTTCTFFPHNSLTYSDTVEKIASLKLCPGNECLAKAQNPVYSPKVAPDNATGIILLRNFNYSLTL